MVVTGGAGGSKGDRVSDRGRGSADDSEMRAAPDGPPNARRTAPPQLAEDGAGARAPSPLGAPGPQPERRRRRRGRRGRRPQPRGSRGGGWRATDHAGLLIGSLNVQSVKPKLLELSQEMHRFNYDVMALQETWLKPSTPNRLLSLPGYQIHRTDRPDGRGYGGVALAVKTGIDTAQLKVPEQRHPGSALETLWMLLKLDGDRQVIVASVYRPPSRTVAALSSYFTDLEAQYQRVIVDHPNTDILICGDLNYDLRKPESDQGCRRLSQFISDFSLHQAIRSPTYRTGSLLDVCIAKQSHSIVRRGVRFCHFSPHLFLRAFIRTSKPRLKPFTVQTRSVTSIDLSSFYADLRRVDWTPIFSVPSVSHKWQLFLNMFSPLF